jgi:hypothetical protein
MGMRIKMGEVRKRGGLDVDEGEGKGTGGLGKIRRHQGRRGGWNGKEITM